MEKKYILYYFGKTSYSFSWDNEYLSTIGSIFFDGCSLDAFLYEKLQDPNFERTGGNSTDIKIEGRTAIVTRDCMWYDEDCYEAKIDRDALFRLLQRWFMITKNRPELIIMRQEDDGEVTLTSRLDTRKVHKQLIADQTKFMILENFNGWYRVQRFSSEYLYSLLNIMLQERNYLDVIKNELQNSNPKPIKGDINTFTIENNIVSIDLAYSLKEAEWLITIKRGTFANLLNDWSNAIKTKPETITVTLQENGEIIVVGKPKQEPNKSNFITLNNLNEKYYKGPEYNKYLSSLVNIFIYEDLDRVKKKLQNPSGLIAKGLISGIVTKGEATTIKCQYLDDYDEPEIEIDRTTLLNLLITWEEIIKNRPAVITVTQHDNGTISIT